MFPLLGDSGPWQLLNVSITRRFHTLVIFLFLLDVSITERFTVTRSSSTLFVDGIIEYYPFLYAITSVE